MLILDTENLDLIIIEHHKLIARVNTSGNDTIATHLLELSVRVRRLARVCIDQKCRTHIHLGLDHTFSSILTLSCTNRNTLCEINSTSKPSFRSSHHLATLLDRLACADRRQVIQRDLSHSLLLRHRRRRIHPSC